MWILLFTSWHVRNAHLEIQRITMNRVYYLWKLWIRGCDYIVRCSFALCASDSAKSPGKNKERAITDLSKCFKNERQLDVKAYSRIPE